MKLGIYEVGILPSSIKRQNKELQPFQQWQFLGKNYLSATFISLLDLFIKTNNNGAIEQLANPKPSYKNQDSLQISQFINSLRTKQINTKEFFILLKNIDNLNTKCGQLLDEFCDIKGLRKTQTEARVTTEKISQYFSLQINLIGQRSIGNSIQSQIYFYKNDDGFYLIKQTSPIIQYLNPPKQQCLMCSHKCDDYFINSDCLHITCWKCLREKVKKSSSLQTIQCNNGCKDKILVRDAQQYIKEEQNKQNLEQSLILSKSQQFGKDKCEPQTFHSQIINQNSNQVLYDNLADSTYQICNYCSQPYNQQLYINKSCNHKFCIDCFKQRIFKKGQACAVKDCNKAIDDNFFQQRIQLENDTQQYQKSIQNEIQQNQKPKQTDIQQNQQPKQISNNQMTKCNKCKNEYSIKSLYKDKKCFHFICFSCIQQQVQNLLKKQQKLYQVRCPCCTNYFGTDFEQYYDQQQFQLVQERIQSDEQLQKEEERLLFESIQLSAFQKEKEEKQKQLQNFDQVSNQKTEKYSSRFTFSQEQQQQQQRNEQQNNSSSVKNLLQSTQDKKVQEDIQQKVEKGECTMCQTNFSQYNMRQQIDCVYHKIGVCCSIKFDKCPQCEQKKVNPQMIRVKQKLILQTFIQKVEFNYSHIYNSSSIQSNNVKAEDYSRINSRANNDQSQTKSQYRNSTMDNNIIRSQAVPQNRVVNNYGAGYRN
ncbi:unnamed protein product [Paramecium sonneborni]|uniref:RING-type domain-containing protein n=1 Tax=Paramecium sonneborni TaxID=65129 RepID=A0A8S1N1Y0_9CILI|nr:unnamed protein product [Paramecium sonneborni]